MCRTLLNLSSCQQLQTAGQQVSQQGQVASSSSSSSSLSQLPLCLVAQVSLMLLSHSAAGAAAAVAATIAARVQVSATPFQQLLLRWQALQVLALPVLLLILLLELP
jgi:hypothetical protein